MRKMLLASIAAAPLAFSVSAAGFAQTVSGESQAEARSAQSGGLAPAAASEEDNIVVVGTRRRGRTDDQSLVPIDVIQPDIIGSTGYSDLNDALRTLVPAFNVKRLPLNDGSSFVRPATLRSSPADHVLLLLNGRRRHRSATVQIGTGHATTSGSQGQDFNVIPPIALSSIEVLRDGASAQYGSDAIAGVINLTLKSAPEGGNISFETGQYFDDGGETADLQVNVGLPLTDAGFINLSAQYISQNETIRAGTHVGAQALRDMGVPGVPTPAMNTGDPQTQALKTVWNAGLDLGGGREAYLFGNYMQSDTEVGFFYRQSQAAGGLGQHATYADSAFDGTPAHPEIFNLASIYPGGYTPLFGGEQTDFSTVLGLS
ncbi:TonB-dependent receptor plug domain-containing protein, partial [Henriciella pelagia]